MCIPRVSLPSVEIQRSDCCAPQDRLLDEWILQTSRNTYPHPTPSISLAIMKISRALLPAAMPPVNLTLYPDVPEAMEQRYLRWNGWLIRYALGGSKDPAAPTALLVHGFGASSDQWDRVFDEFSPSKPSVSSANPPESGDNIAADAADASAGGTQGVRLLALDLVGFGHSAKPPLSFSQYSWADCARDVALRAGGGPFFIAGNSIGG